MMAAKTLGTTRNDRKPRARAPIAPRGTHWLPRLLAANLALVVLAPTVVAENPSITIPNPVQPLAVFLSDRMENLTDENEGAIPEFLAEVQDLDLTNPDHYVSQGECDATSPPNPQDLREVCAVVARAFWPAEQVNGLSSAAGNLSTGFEDTGNADWLVGQYTDMVNRTGNEAGGFLVAINNSANVAVEKAVKPIVNAALGGVCNGISDAGPGFDPATQCGSSSVVASTYKGVNGWFGMSRDLISKIETVSLCNSLKSLVTLVNRMAGDAIPCGLAPRGSSLTEEGGALGKENLADYVPGGP